MGNSSVRAEDRLIEQGYVMLTAVFDESEMASLAGQLSAAFQDRDDPSILRSEGRTYGSRNVLEVFPKASALLRRPALREFVTTILGPDAGIVRVLFFDKPPDRSWSLPWHEDRTIAVARNDLPSEQFRNPTIKAGVPHVVAPSSVSESMLALRIHLDPMGAANGPLCVIPGSHRKNDDEPRQPVELHANPGDVLAMRPLLTHSSIMSRAGTTLHRRVIHFEVARKQVLPDGYEWHTFMPIDKAS